MKYNQLINTLFKPFVQLRKVGRSINRYRKQFRYLVREKGSIGKAYQFLRKMYKVEGLKTTKKFLKNYTISIPQSNHIKIRTQRWRRDASISNNTLENLTYFSNSFNKNSMNIHWVIPDFGKGGGGHQTIFRMIKFLENFGHRQTIWLQNADDSINLSIRKKQIQEWYAPIENVFIEYLPDNVEHISGDVIIATEAFSAYPVGAMKFFKERFYFIQDNEAQFYPMGTNYLLASNTYDFGFSALCAGNWLLEMAQARGMWARSWELCADHSVYFPKNKHIQKEKDNIVKIAFYARKHTERRAVDLGLAALQELHDRGIKFEVYLFGQEKNEFQHYTFNHVHLGLLSTEELSDLYNNVDIGMVFSSTNYSLIPLEMMACALPIVELDVPSTQAVFPNKIVSLAKPNVKDIADTLEKLILDNVYRANLAVDSFEFASKTNWEHSARKIEAAIIEKLEEKGFHSYTWNDVLIPTEQKAIKASVVIPTYNPNEDEILNLITMIKKQKTDWNFEILVLDSSSTNGSIDKLEQMNLDSVRIVRINKSEFQHGRTRKYAAEISLGEIIVYTTQDAMPKNEYWLSNLIKPFDEYHEVAGVFGRHEAYATHDIFTQRDITNFFNELNQKPMVRKWNMSNFESPNSLGGKLFRCFFSDNNSAVRKQVVKHIPYPEVDWGEDQVWANEIISSGLAIAYANSAIIIHSHEYDKEKTLYTAIQEEKMFSKYFGYYFAHSKKEVEENLAHQIRSDGIWAKKHHIETEVFETRKRLLTDQMYGRCNRFFITTDKEND